MQPHSEYSTAAPAENAMNIISAIARLSHEQEASLGDASSREPGELLAFAKNNSNLVDIKTS